MRQRIHVLLAATLLLAAAPASAVPFGGLVVFGDSLSDGGNAYLALGGTVSAPPYDPVPSAPYASGRFTNGPVAAEVAAQAWGLPLAPSLAAGTNFAFGGARTGTDTMPPGLQTQLAQYLTATGGAADPTALYWIWGGGNDLRDAAISPDPAADIAAAVSNLAAMVGDLVAAGARYLVVLNAPDFGMTPAAAAAGLAVEATALSAAFNTALALALDPFAGLPGVRLWQVDVFGLMQAVAADPAAWGLSDISNPCLSFSDPDPATAVCGDPDAHLFWDAIHPTAAGHRLVAMEVLRTVPEPATWLLVAAGGLLALRRRAAAG